MAFGRFQSRPAPAPLSEINVTPLVDVMLVLVVIFLLTAPLLTSQIRLDLPASGAGQSAAPAATSITLSITANGDVFLNDLATPVAELATQLATTARERPDTEVLLRADTDAPYGKVVQVMGIAQKAGLSRVGFAVQPSQR